MLRLLPVSPIPADTARVAAAAIPEGNTCLRLRSFLGTIFRDQQFASLFSTRGQPAATPWRLALVTQMEHGYDLTAFAIDWDGHFAICPQGKRSSGWWINTDTTRRQVISTKFSRTDCSRCTVNTLCTKNGAKNPRKLSLRPREEHELLIASRKEQRTPEWKQLYNRRAGIEATFSQGVRSLGLRRSRYRGLPKCHLQNVAIACAINLQRLSDYWSGVLPAPTRTSAFAHGSCENSPTVSIREDGLGRETNVSQADRQKARSGVRLSE